MPRWRNILSNERIKIHENFGKIKRCCTRSDRTIGQPLAQILASFKKYYPMWEDEVIIAPDLAMLVGVSRLTLYKYLQ